jgi:hypothetical protein
MSSPTHASGLPGSAALGAYPASTVDVPSGERSRRVVRASRERERRLRAQAGWSRLVSVCRRELLVATYSQDAGGEG